jgi:hypothetical protein
MTLPLRQVGVLFAGLGMEARPCYDVTVMVVLHHFDVAGLDAVLFEFDAVARLHTGRYAVQKDS